MGLLINFQSPVRPFLRVNGQERFSSVGITECGRLLFVVWTMRGEKIRAVTAFDAPYAVRR
jgi:uncharacterized DUF497 family protein